MSEHHALPMGSTIGILGLPEGSIELADRDTLEAMACTLDPAPSAA